jgi:hypothetical protein
MLPLGVAFRFPGGCLEIAVLYAAAEATSRCTHTSAQQFISGLQRTRQKPASVRPRRSYRLSLLSVFASIFILRWG